MNDLEDIKEEITDLVFSGKKDDALALLQSRYSINKEEAEKLLALAIKESVTPATFFKRLPKIASEGKGCKKTIFGMIAFGFGFFGIPMFLAAIGFGIYYHNDAEYRMDIFGQVIDYDSYNDANGVTQYTPVISYALDDKEYTCKGTVYQSPPEYAIGDVIPLQVHPEDPESVYIDTFSERWLVVVILGSVSFVFIILMLVFTFMSRRL